MNPDTLEEYLSGLLGQEFGPDSRVRLTSGQRARLVSWAEAQGLAINRSVVGQAEFTLSEALSEGSPAADRSLRKPSQVPSTRPAAAASSVGIDIQRIDELIPVSSDFKSNDEIAGIFSRREISYAETRADARETLAGLFSAKEAIRKADAAYVDVPLVKIEVLPDADGKPRFADFALSISHSGEYAVACATRSTLTSIEQAGAPSAPKPIAPVTPERPKAAATASEKQQRRNEQRKASGWSGGLRLVLIVLASFTVGILVPDIF